MTSNLPAGDGMTSDAPAESELDQNAAPETGEPRPASGGDTQLDGPALENPEMHRATDDLRSSEIKSGQAREIVDDLAASTQPSP